MIEQILRADRYLQVDQVEKARDVYQKVVDMDPGNGIAVVGLARCALADGEDQQAYELASRALEIDPENDMARRMEARLSEILATRGEAVARPAAAATPSVQEMRRVVTEMPDEPADGSEAATAADPARVTAADPTPEPAAAPAPKPAAMEGTPTLAQVSEPAPKPPTATKPKPSTPTPTTAKAKEPAVRKSLFDRLMGR